MLNYNTTSLDLEEYIVNFLLDEFNVICDEGDDDSYKEVVDTIINLYEQSKKGETEDLDKLRKLDAQMKECMLKRLENELELQKKFEEHMKEINPEEDLSEEDQMNEEEKNQLEEEGFTVIEKKKKRRKN
jgi:hypothetical protein